jgi:hypothetical protein
MSARVIAIVVLASACFAAPLGAKGKTVKLVVSGGGHHQPIEISGKDVMFANPWDDAFVDPWNAVPPPPSTAPRYEVSFYEELGRGNIQMKYAVDYAPHHGGGAAGTIHLPGRGDQRYRLNARTILRDGRDGLWFPASAEWERVVGSRVR